VWAAALLADCFGRFWGRGERRIGLGVDAKNTAGAFRLYERAGMAPELGWGRRRVKQEVEAWLARAGCEGEEAARVRELASDRIGGGWITLDRTGIRRLKA